ncbi:transposable element [Tanacetum coccineum]
MVDDKVEKVPSTSTLVDPTSSNWARPVLTNARLVVEVFDGTDHFGMWQSEVLDSLFQQGLDIAVEESKPEDVEERNCNIRLQIVVALEEKFLKKNCQNKLFMKTRLFRFTYVQGLLPKEYELLETTLLNGKDDVSLSEVCIALYSKELRRKDKQISSSGDAEVLLVRGRSQKKGTDKRWRSKSRQRLSKDEWKAVAEANVTKCDDEESDLSLATSSSRNASKIWLLDSACSHHITPHREWFSNFEEHEEVVYTADETPLTTYGIGSVRLQNEDRTIVTLKGVRYSPKLKKNLISVGTLESKGFEVRANDGVMKIIYGVLVVMKGIRKINNTYHYKGRTVVGTLAAVTDGDRNSEAVKLWHMRLGHAREKSLNLLIKQGLLKGLSSCKLDLCEHCINGKTTMVKFGTTIHKTQGILDYVHSDVWGPSKTRSLGGRHYYVTFVDDFSRRVWVYTLKTKDEVLGVFIKWKKMMETQTCRKIKHLRTDNGGEYKNDLFTKFCEDEGIVRHFTVRHTPQQNGVAERMNRTLLEKVRCMLSNAGLGKEFWAEAVTYACHLVNRLPSTAIDGKTPFEKWYGKPATDYDSLHVFGSAAYYHVKESKLDPRAKKALFMGITSGIKGYRLWCPETKKTIFSRDVTFNESAIEPNYNSPVVEGDYAEEDVQAEEPRQKQHESIATSKLKRNTKRPARLNDTVACASSIAADDVSTTYSEAVYAKKEGFPSQDDVRYKARLVVKGYAQKEGIDYNEVFSPLVKHSSIRILLALVAQLDLELVQMDVKTAFLHGDLEEEIYMVQPEGFKVAGKEHEVYDMLIASQSSDEIEKLKTRLKSEFEMKDLGKAKMILDMEIVRDRKLRKLCLTQKQYLRRVLKRFREGIDGKDYAGDLDKRRSTTGYVFTLAKAPVSWKSTLQSTTALLTTEAEYMAMTEAVKEAIWLQGLLGELGIKQKFVTMHSHSQSAIHLAKNQTPPKMVDGEIEEWIFAKVEICKNNVAHREDSANVMSERFFTLEDIGLI